MSNLITHKGRHTMKRILSAVIIALLAVSPVVAAGSASANSETSSKQDSNESRKANDARLKEEAKARAKAAQEFKKGLNKWYKHFVDVESRAGDQKDSNLFATKNKRVGSFGDAIPSQPYAFKLSKEDNAKFVEVRQRLMNARVRKSSDLAKAQALYECALTEAEEYNPRQCLYGFNVILDRLDSNQ